MGRFHSVGALAAFLLMTNMPMTAPVALGADEGRTLVLPFRSVGIGDETIAVTRDLLAGELETRGVMVVSIRPMLDRLPSGIDGCDETECARRLARELSAEMVVYGSLSRLGDKIIARVHALRLDEEDPFYTDQLTAMVEEDLDQVMLRIAEGIAAGAPNSADPSVESVIHAETEPPLRRASRRGVGIRAGFLFPTGDSYGGVERLTSMRLAYKYEGRDYMIETTTLAGLTFGRSFSTVEWHIFDLFGARIVGLKNNAIYFGAGAGVHAIRVEGEPTSCPSAYYCGSPEQGAATLSLDLGVGLLGLRTYDFQIVVDLRYHYVFEDFEDVDGKGAHGFSLVFGTNH